MNPAAKAIFLLSVLILVSDALSTTPTSDADPSVEAKAETFDGDALKSSRLQVSPRATSSYSLQEGLIIFTSPKHDDATMIPDPWWNGDLMGLLKEAIGFGAAPSTGPHEAPLQLFQKGIPGRNSRKEASILYQSYNNAPTSYIETPPEPYFEFGPDQAPIWKPYSGSSVFPQSPPTVNVPITVNVRNRRKRRNIFRSKKLESVLVAVVKILASSAIVSFAGYLVKRRINSAEVNGNSDGAAGRV